MNNLIQTNNFLAEKADMYTGTLSQNTKRAYLTDIRDFFGVSDIKNITIDMIQAVTEVEASLFRDRLEEEGKALSTINRKMTSLSSFYTFMCKRHIGIMTYNPFQETKRMKYNKRHSSTRCLTKDEVQDYVQVAMVGDDLLSQRNRIIFMLLATTGLRRSELTTMKIGHIATTHGKTIINITRKGSQEGIIVLSSTVVAFIKEYISTRGLTLADKDKYLFVSHSTNGSEGNKISAQTIYNIVKDMSAKAGVDYTDVSPHSFRHTFITESLHLGAKLEDIQDMVGHADISTTQRYDHTNRVVENSTSDALTERFMNLTNYMA
jgi:integrase/recombinase XerD